MKNHIGVVIKVNFPGTDLHLDTTVQMWDEHNHASVYRGDDLVFDGYYPQAIIEYKNEISRLCKIAEKSGKPFEVVKM